MSLLPSPEEQQRMEDIHRQTIEYNREERKSFLDEHDILLATIDTLTSAAINTLSGQDERENINSQQYDFQSKTVRTYVQNISQQLTHILAFYKENNTPETQDVLAKLLLFYAGNIKNEAAIKYEDIKKHYKNDIEELKQETLTRFFNLTTGMGEPEPFNSCYQNLDENGLSPREALERVKTDNKKVDDYIAVFAQAAEETLEISPKLKVIYERENDLSKWCDAVGQFKKLTRNRAEKLLENQESAPT